MHLSYGHLVQFKVLTEVSPLFCKWINNSKKLISPRGVNHRLQKFLTYRSPSLTAFLQNIDPRVEGKRLHRKHLHPRAAVYK